MHRHGGVQTSGQDVYVNVVGGLKITETGSDLAVLLACAQVYAAKPYRNNWSSLVKLDFSWWNSSVPNVINHKEAIKHGFKYIILPRGNVPQKTHSKRTNHFSQWHVYMKH